MTPRDAALLCAVPLAIGVAKDAIGLLAIRGQLSDGGIMSFAVLSTRPGRIRWSGVTWAAERVFRYPNVLVLPLVELLAAAALLASAVAPSGASRAVASVSALTLAVVLMCLDVRCNEARFTAHRMFLVVSLGVAGALVAPHRTAAAVAIGYIAAQLVLGYVVAGFSKLRDPSWRTGTAMVSIASTVEYGHDGLSGVLRRHRWLAVVLAWSVLGFECLGPALLLLGRPGAIALMCVGLAFHVGVSVFMGLDLFLWAFVACYPAVWFFAA